MASSVTNGPRLTIGSRIGPVAWSRTISKPDSTKRVKPKDLFNASTDRSVFSSETYNTTYLAWDYADPNLDYYDFLSAGAWTSFDNLSTAVLLEARGKLLDKVKRQNVSMAQSIAEFRQTADLFLTLSQELLQGWRALRRLHFGELYRDLKRSREFSKKWIEFQFGLLPLVSDITGLLESLHDTIRDGSWIHVEVRVSKTERRTRTISDSIGNGKIIQDATGTMTSKLKGRYRIRNAFIDDFRRFGFSNAAALGWELVPFSFVVDWAIDIGDWISRQDALLGAADFTYIPSGENRREYLSTGRGGKTASTKSITRFRSAAQSNLPIPRPRYDPSPSLRKVVTGLSLIRLLGR